MIGRREKFIAELEIMLRAEYERGRSDGYEAGFEKGFEEGESKQCDSVALHEQKYHRADGQLRDEINKGEKSNG